MTRSSRVRRPATLASLAAELGVSRTTVSNAYNRPDQLSVQLRTRVLETARRLGYPGPDPVARSLRTRQARAVGLLLTEELSFAFRDPAALGFLEGLAGACEDAGQGLLLMPASRGDTDVTAVHQASVDGFVVYSVPERDPHLMAVLERPLPTVVADQPMDVEGVDRVGVDDRGGMLAMARHLTALGHRRIGVICMRLSNTRHDGYADPQRQRRASFPVQRERLRGLREGFAEAGVDWAEVPVVERFEHSIEAGASAASELLGAHLGLTALVCTSDVLALGGLADLLVLVVGIGLVDRRALAALLGAEPEVPDVEGIAQVRRRVVGRHQSRDETGHQAADMRRIVHFLMTETIKTIVGHKNAHAAQQ